MNVKLAFSPVSKNPVDLLAVVLDAEATLHEIDDPAVGEHVERAAAGFRDKTLKREYYATLGEGASARAVVVYWSPQLRSWNLWENVKTFTARALRLARDYRFAKVGVVVNAKDAAPYVGKVTEGAVLGAYTFDRYRQEKDEFLAKEAELTIFAHPDHETDAEARKARYLWVSENVNRARDFINEPGAAVTPEVFAQTATEIASEVNLEAEVLDPEALEARGYQGIVRVGTREPVPGTDDRAAPDPPQAVQADPGHRRQGHHLRHRGHQPQARRQDVGDEGRHGGSGGHAVHHARPRQAPAGAQGRRDPLLRGEHARRQRPAAGRHLHRQERQVDAGGQHRRRGPPGPDGRPGPGRRGGRHPHPGHRHPDRRGPARPWDRASPGSWARIPS